MNRSITLNSRPSGEITAAHFAIKEIPDFDIGGSGNSGDRDGKGDVVIKLHHLSIDPYLRGKMNDGKSYTEPFAVGGAIENSAVGQITASRNANFVEGDWVVGFLPWQDYALVKSDQLVDREIRKVQPQEGVPLSWHLGILGMPGMTAWVGLKGLGKPVAGETVFVSAASGAVGMTVAQIARQMGCRVTGCVGSQQKLDYVTSELGFDAAFNYKDEPNLADAFKRICPDGIDINFENVGGDISLAAFNHLNDFGRMIVCGVISNYQNSTPQPGPSLRGVLTRKIKIQGFIVSDHATLCAEWLEVAPRWVSEGKLKYNESIKHGLENAPEALMDVLAGRNFGKQIVNV